MFNFTEIKPLVYDVLSTAWDEVDIRWKVALTINLSAGKTITPDQQLRAFYKGRVLKHYDPETIRINFHTIFQDNLFLVIQIENYINRLNELNNLDNWSVVSKNTMTNNSDGKNTVMAGNSSAARGGSSDSNSNNNQDLLNDHFKIGEDIKTPLNNLTINLSQDLGITENTTNSNVNSESISKTDNKANDLIAYLNLKIPELRRNFWSCFGWLFK